MSRQIVACVVALCGLVSVGASQSAVSVDASLPNRVSPEQTLLKYATELATNGDFQGAWQVMNLGGAQGGVEVRVLPARLGWRTATVAGSLRNRADYAKADAFVRFALAQPWSEGGRTLSKAETAQAGYWCAWLASEILDDRTSALTWIEKASAADSGSEEIRELKTRLTDAERSFPKR